MKNNQKAILNFVYFSTNFPYNWESQCFKDDQHIINKYRESEMVPARFILELDRANQLKMIDWISNNYLAFENFKLQSNTKTL